ncbi:MAG TPA: stimulus-sensing domain-containing protein [Thermoanaerobaculia bacterium]
MPFLSRISVRLLLFNVLLVLVPVAGFLYLDIFEDQLLNDQERSMVQQGRLLAAALGSQGPLDGARAQDLIRRLEQRTEARLRIFGGNGGLLADSSRLGPKRGDDSPAASKLPGGRARDNFLYRVAAGIYRAYRDLRDPGPARRTPPPAHPYPEKVVRDALAGRYGATIGPTGGERWRPSVTLHSAIPIRSGGEVMGAVLVSQSTVRILRELDEVRLDVFKVFLGSVGVAAVLSLLLAGTIARPLRRLRDEANALLDRRGRLRGRFRGSRRSDEIGDLARALEGLTARLEEHLRFVESFAADVSHEFKNPLAAIRSATELLAESEDPADRERFLGMVQREVARMERLLSGVREVSEIDARLETEEAGLVDLAALLREHVESLRGRSGTVGFELRAPGHPVWVRASPERLSQVFENLLDNARGFSPAGGAVTVGLAAWDGAAAVHVEDQGPGIPESHLGRIFDRFFTWRPNEPGARDGHTGLGLAIAKAIVEGYGGSIVAGNRPEGGARFEVRLPRAGL